MQIFGHRGSSETDPENTLRAIRRAIADGAHGIEFDVQRSADGTPVLLHDRALDRTTNGTGNIDHLTLAQLRALDAGSGERIPTLVEVLEEVGDRVYLDIELKQPAIEADVLGVLAQFPQARWSISSFDWTTLQRCRAHSRSADLWVLATHVSDALFPLAAEISATAVALWSPMLTAESAERLRDAGLDVVVWTVNDVAEARRVRGLGARALCTDAPGRLMAELAS